MRKTLFYFLLLLMVAVGVYFLVFHKEEKTFSESETGFTIKDTAAVGRIYMVRNNGMYVDLKRTTTGWQANDIYPARISTVNTLLSTLYKQVPKYPASVKKHNNLVKSMAGNSVKVELYDLKGKLINAFYIGPDEEKAFGTYMLKQGAEHIFLVQIPLFEGCLSAIYSTYLQDWRSRNVMDIPADAIEEASINYPVQTSNSFTIKQNKGLQMIVAPSVAKGRPLNEKRVKTFLSFFSNLNCEGFLVGVPGMDTVIRRMPQLCNIKVMDNKGNKNEVDIYLMPVNKRSKNLISNKPNNFDAERLYAIFNNHKDTAVVQYLSFEKLLRSAGEFYETDSVLTYSDRNNQ